jgi:DNA-directed RNA polymerase subunit M/transcription elongation factor TFIIS
MGTFHNAGEWLRLSEHYRQMTDGELIAIARDRPKLTEIAQQILALELSQRKLKVELENSSGSSASKPGDVLHLKSKDMPRSQPNDRETEDSCCAGDPYAEDRKLVELLTVWSMSDALQLERILNMAGIPFFMGAEDATSVDTVTSSFPSGVSVKVMRIGVPWAHQALQKYEPLDVPESEKQQWLEDVDVRCPTCHSTDIVFKEMAPAQENSTPKYKWTCSLCGHDWEDDGIATAG